jgi:hypothetical protein
MSTRGSMLTGLPRRSGVPAPSHESTPDPGRERRDRFVSGRLARRPRLGHHARRRHARRAGRAGSPAPLARPGDICLRLGSGSGRACLRRHRPDGLDGHTRSRPLGRSSLRRRCAALRRSCRRPGAAWSSTISTVVLTCQSSRIRGPDATRQARRLRTHRIRAGPETEPAPPRAAVGRPSRGCRPRRSASRRCRRPDRCCRRPDRCCRRPDRCPRRPDRCRRRPVRSDRHSRRTSSPFRNRRSGRA